MRLSVCGAVLTVLLGATLVACSDDKPAVCSSVDDLQTSVDDLKSIDVTSSTAVSDLQSGLSTVESNFTDVKTDAESQFSSQIDAVDTALGTLNSSIDTAKSDPTNSALAAVGSAASALIIALQTLSDDVKSTC